MPVRSSCSMVAMVVAGASKDEFAFCRERKKSDKIPLYLTRLKNNFYCAFLASLNKKLFYINSTPMHHPFGGVSVKSTEMQ